MDSENQLRELPASRFVVQRHEARSPHFDFRLEIGGVYKSWVLPKGPPTHPSQRRLAILTEDHPLAFGDFEGTIPDGEYGAGKITIWDRGTYQLVGFGTAGEQFERGDLRFELHGQRLVGHYGLLILKRGRWRREPPSRKEWLLVKSEADEFSSSL